MNLYIYTRAVNWQLQLVGQYDKNGQQNDTKDQKVIQIDALRTRTQLFDDELRKCLIDVLNIYQSNKHHSYKQGLNELAAPFVYLNKASLDSDKIYDLLNTFIETYMTNFFDNDFASLQNLFLLLDFLIQYHDKEIHNYFQRKMVSSQLFACPWMVTMFVSKSTFPASLLIIEHQLLCRNKYFILFFCTAVIIQQREKILKSGQYPPMILTKIEVDIDDFYSYLKLAIQLQQSTPSNYFEYVDNSHVFGPNNSVFQNKIELLRVSPQEIIQHVKNVKKNQFQLANFKQENEQLKKMKEIYRTTLGLNFLPVLVFPYIKTDIHCNAHFVSLNTIPRATIKAQLINLSMTNKLWICIFDAYENALKLSHSELFNEFSYFNYCNDSFDINQLK
ncbi:hypothetical protein pb186bvf_001493 [Paramecium bursaria]